MENQEISDKGGISKTLVKVTTVSLAIVASIRGVIAISEFWLPLSIISFFVISLILLEGVVKKLNRLIQYTYFITQLILVCCLYYIAPLADFWALMLLPACSAVMIFFKRRVAYVLIVIFSISIGVMLIRAEGITSLQYIPIYFIAFITIGTFSYVLEDTRKAKNRAQELSIKLKEANKSLRNYSEQTTDLAIVEERSLIARELHDSVTQTIFSLNLLLNSLEHKYILEPEALKADIAKIAELSDSAMKELRGIINQFQPGANSGLSFYSQLAIIIDDYNFNHSTNISIDHKCQAIPRFAQKALLLIIKEAIHNFMKHSGVNEAEVKFSEENSILRIEIEDKGIGYDCDSKDKINQHGILNMKTRALEIGANLSINSEVGAGTSVIIELSKK